jgi:hypothetical protein
MTWIRDIGIERYGGTPRYNIVLAYKDTNSERSIWLSKDKYKKYWYIETKNWMPIVNGHLISSQEPYHDSYTPRKLIKLAIGKPVKVKSYTRDK